MIRLLIFSFSLIVMRSSVTGQGATCASRIATLWPRKMFNVERLTGEWMAIQMGWMNDSLIQEPYAKCASQVISKISDDPLALGIQLRLDFIEDGTHVERDGKVNLTVTDSAIWRWSYFDNPSQAWEGVVIATDYTRFWIHYECEERAGFRIETVVLRHRDRVVGPGQIDIFQNLMEGLGFPIDNLVSVPQPSDCGMK